MNEYSLGNTWNKLRTVRRSLIALFSYPVEKTELGDRVELLPFLERGNKL